MTLESYTNRHIDTLEPSTEDGYRVEIYESAHPAKSYDVYVPALDVRFTTGAGGNAVALKEVLSENLAAGMLGFREGAP